MDDVVIIGQGNIGLRHGQSLLKSSNVRLEVRDTSEGLLSAQKFYESLTPLEALSRCRYIERGEKFGSKEYELGIIATDSSNRFNALSELIQSSVVKFVLLEKPLTNSIGELMQMKKMIGVQQNYFVNLPREQMKLFLDIKQFLISNGSKINSIKISGGRIGLASNLIHFFRICEFLTDSPTSRIENEGPLRKTHSKRSGYFELIGKIQGFTGSEIYLEILSEDYMAEIHFEIECSNQKIQIFEESGKVLVNNHELFTCPIELQSNMTLQSLRKIQNQENGLPNFTEVYELQLLILEFLGKTELYDSNTDRIRFS